MRTTVAALLFAATWLLWSGVYNPLTVILGAISCALVTVLARKIGFFEADVYTLHLGRRLPRFWFWLLGEIAKSNLTVARLVLSPRPPIEPTIVTVDARQLPAVSQAALANSITLTPGTLSMDVNHGLIEVHCLTRDAADQLLEGEMVRRVEALTGR